LNLLAEMTGESTRLTRRRLVALGGAALAGLVVPRVAAGVPALPTRRRRAAEQQAGYVSRPDLIPPPIEITTPASGTAPGLIFLGPFAAGLPGAPPPTTQTGPLIVDDAGEPVWFLPMAKNAALELRIQKFRGRRVLTWYEGPILGGYGGDFVIFDPTYHRIARVKAGHGYDGDSHEFLLTSRGTALIGVYSELTADLSPVGGPVDGKLVEGIVQEIDVESGKVLFEWHSFEHVPVEESYETQPTFAGNVDYFHLNSIAVDTDGQLIVSARNTSTVYKVDRKSGDVIWRLGGKKSDFEFGPGAEFTYQHDVRPHADGIFTVFDNAIPHAPGAIDSHGLKLSLDTQAMRATLVQEYRAPAARPAVAMGNVQQLADGGVFVGWGSAGWYSEFGPDGQLRLDARFPEGVVSYRAYRCTFVGRPTGKPAVAIRRNDDGETMTVYASWNGATEIASWRVRTGPAAAALKTATTSPRSGFETAITLPVASGYVSVVALDAEGKRLGASPAIPT
jgi:hypothetical protein